MNPDNTDHIIGNITGNIHNIFYRNRKKKSVNMRNSPWWMKELDILRKIVRAMK